MKINGSYVNTAFIVAFILIPTISGVAVRFYGSDTACIVFLTLMGFWIGLAHKYL